MKKFMKKLFGYRSFKCLLVGIPPTALGIILQQSSINTDYKISTISSMLFMFGVIIMVLGGSLDMLKFIKKPVEDTEDCTGENHIDSESSEDNEVVLTEKEL